MRAVVLEARNSPLVVVDDYPEPGANGSEVIDVIACGLCHSDLHVVAGEFPSPLPIVLGHEVTGNHPELGPVMVYAPWGCGRCRECADGYEMICADATEAGLVVDGGCAERMAIADRAYLYPLGDLDPVASAPLACGGLTGYRAVQQTLETLRRPGRKRRVLVIGAGGIGQFALRYLKLLTDAEVYALDRAPDKRDTAVALGADGAFDADDDLPLFDAVVDFVALDATLALAAGAVARRGLVVAVGLYGGRVPFGVGAVPHEARFMSSIWGTRPQLGELLDLARREPSIIAPVETMAFTDAQVAHDRLRAGDVQGRLVLLIDQAHAN
ncbi:alcohol dehydrogenase catalytic domain-containing protein [Candidatus Poriferisocius sp.]|uniref:alcohol dehydrogenase catalytic domain-containing protein n=1 Tax=Candidatus Poriferisocius sp. TaxID=3101276 RepID=UPI003B0271A6